MKKIVYIILICIMVTTSSITNMYFNIKNNSSNIENKDIFLTSIAYSEPIIFDGLTQKELTIKLNRNLYNELEGTGEYFAQFAKETGMDPYLAISILNLETGCKWNCSYLAKKCYNLGGLKGTPNCDGSSYMKFNSLYEGIISYLDILYNNYWSKGLDTPEKMNPKYAESNLWAEKVNKYYNEIKNN